MSWGTIISAAVSAGSAYMGKKSADKAQKRMKRAGSELGSVEFLPKTIQGPGGINVAFGDDGTQFGLGDFQQIFDVFGDISFDSLGMGQELQGAAGEFMPGLFGGLGNALTLSEEAFDRIGDLQFNGFQRGLQDALFGGAQQTADVLSGGFEGIRSSTSNLLNQLAAPREERIRQNLAENLFGQGTIGQKSGQMLVESTAQGLSNAGLERDLAANEEARRTLGANLGLLEGQLSGGAGLAGLEAQLLNDAFSQFGGTLGLASDLQSGIFSQGSALFNQGGQALGGQTALINMLMSLGGFAGDLESTRSQVDIAAKGGQANVLSNLGASGNDMLAAFLGTLGSNISDMDLKSMFGNSNVPTEGLNQPGYTGVGT